MGRVPGLYFPTRDALLAKLGNAPVQPVGARHEVEMPDDRRPRGPVPHHDGSEPESIPVLIERAQRGDQTALDRLFQRSYPIMRRLAHGRLPSRLRGEKDTSDVVQITFLRALRSLKEFESNWENAWLIYMRRILFNHLRDEGRRAGRSPAQEVLPEDDSASAIEGHEPSPLEQAALQETVSAYREALARLSEPERLAVILRLEQGESHAQIAARLGLPSGDAARMLVKRTIGKVAEMVEPPAGGR